METLEVGVAGVTLDMGEAGFLSEYCLRLI
jgi:hypothetical protein